jgi:hypothetical protein
MSRCTLRSCVVFGPGFRLKNWAATFEKNIRAPQPNGKNAGASLDALETPSANLSGLNSSASSPQTPGLWWMHPIGNENTINLSFELLAAYFQLVSSVFLSQQISQQYFQQLIFSPSEQAGHQVGT